jgi:hypothetical protein
MLKPLLLVPVLALFFLQISPTFGETSYRFDVRTPKIKQAGTAANVTIKLIGSKGSHSGTFDGDIFKLKMAKNDSKGKRITYWKTINRFEQGQVDDVAFGCNDLGELKSLIVSHDNRGSKAGWYLQDITVKSNGSSVVFPCNRWLATSADDGQLSRTLKPKNSLSHYIVRVHTGNRSKSGTDARVRMNLEGTSGELSSYQLDCTGDPFENSNVNTIHVYSDSLGELKSLKMWQDGTNDGSGWFLNKVVIMLEGQPQKQWRFDFNRWLDDKRGRSATKTI